MTGPARRTRWSAGRCAAVAAFALVIMGCREGPPPAARMALAPAPDGMVSVPAGTFTMGASPGEPAMAMREAVRPHAVAVTAFYLDRTEVTNAAFARFADATGYRTTAERPVDWERLRLELPPGTPRPADSLLQPGSLVFVRANAPIPLDDERQWWRWTPGVNWRHPVSPASGLDSLASHPVVHVSWEDASAFCTWAGKRLPTEAEWEYAARGGLEGKRFSWGDDPITPARANVWQGEFPVADRGDDGYRGTAPVGAFPPNGYGLVDMAGNVWEWTADRATMATPDPSMAGTADERIIRGGSFLCHASYCTGYRVAARMHASVQTSLMNTGFRCAADARPRERRG